MRASKSHTRLVYVTSQPIAEPIVDYYLHLLPGVPYHALGEAHRRLSRHLDPDSSYHMSSHRGLYPLVGRLAASSFRKGAGR